MTIQDRIQALKSNAFGNSPYAIRVAKTAAEKLALADQRARFADLLSKLPTPRLP